MNIYVYKVILVPKIHMTSLQTVVLSVTAMFGSQIEGRATPINSPPNRRSPMERAHRLMPSSEWDYEGAVKRAGVFRYGK